MENAAGVWKNANDSENGDASPSLPDVSPPSPVHSISSSARSTVPIASTQTRATALPNLPTAPLMNTTTPRSSQPRDMHLLVCVGGREFQTLAKVRHVNVAQDWNDGMLLRALLREYEEARQGQQWSIASLLPALPARIGKLWLSKYPITSLMLDSIRDWPIWDLWRKLVPDGGLWAPLHMPSTADFVKVTVTPREIVIEQGTNFRAAAVSCIFSISYSGALP